MSETSPARGRSCLSDVLIAIFAGVLPFFVIGFLVLVVRVQWPSDPAPARVTDTPGSAAVPLTTIPPQMPGASRGKIAYISFTDERAESSAIMAVDPASGQVSRLTAQGGRYFSPTWLPDGELAYTWGDSTSSSDLFVQRLDGLSLPRRLTDDEHVWAMSLSPDGTHYLFEKSVSDGPVLYRADADGRNLQAVTENWSKAASWSPDGSQIVFMSEFYYHVVDMALLRMDGHSKPVRLTGTGENSEQPAWSPTGEWIAYVSPINGNTSDVCLIHPDGTGRHCVTNSQTTVYEFAWSPDGTQIAFSGGWLARNIWVVNIHDGKMKELTHNTYTDMEPNWSPDGTQIAFSSTLNGVHKDIYVINADGTGLRQLTTGPAVDVYPTWGPD